MNQASSTLIEMDKFGEADDKHHKAHCLILPFPIQSHVNPMLQFAKRLHHKGIQIILLLSRYLAKAPLFCSDIISVVETFSDGYDDGFPPGVSLDTTSARFQQVGPATLREAMRRLVDSGRPMGWIVYDPFMPGALDVAKEFGLAAAAFFTQSCAVDHIYHLVYRGDLRVPLPCGKEIAIPGLPPLESQDMPSFIYLHGSYPTILKSAVDQFRGLEKTDWLFFNTFYKLEKEVIDYMAKFSTVKTIGPAIPSMYLDKRLPDDREYGLSVYKPATGECMEWLNRQQPNSVTYASFGSLAQLGEAQVEELAWSLRSIDGPFLWVLRSSEQSKLPKDFAGGTSEKGLIVPCCPQLEVLAHPAVCCFVTHCGWSSTLEALSSGVPMVAMPQWTDQTTNSKFMVDVWKVGVRAAVGDDGLVRRETIGSCVKEVTEGERGKEIKRNAARWKELAREAMDEGGSSDKEIEDFVSSILGGSVPLESQHHK